MGRTATATTLLVLLSLAAALAGCGGGGEESTAPTSAAAAAAPTTPPDSPKSAKASESPGPHPGQTTGPGPPASAFHPEPHHDSRGGSAQFIVKGGDNSVQEFGAEASESELQAAAGALHAFLDARAERNWAAACTYLSTETKQGFAQLGTSAKPASCPTSLAALSGKVPSATLREAAIADVVSLRAEGNRGFLLYRGAPKGTLYAISMTKDQGSWRVASLAGTPLN